MNKLEKKQYLSDLIETVKTKSGFVLTEYQGLKVEEMTALRRELRPIGCRYTVVKNAITSIAFKETNLSDLSGMLTGPIGMVVLDGDPVPALKKLIKFAKDHDKLKIRSGYVFNKMVTGKEIDAISKLPTREAAIAQLLSALQSPVSSMMNTLQAPIINFMYLLEELKKKQG